MQGISGFSRTRVKNINTAKKKRLMFNVYSCFVYLLIETSENMLSVMCSQRRLKSACASAQSDQILRCPQLWLYKTRQVKILIRLLESGSTISDVRLYQRWSWGSDYIDFWVDCLQSSYSIHAPTFPEGVVHDKHWPMRSNRVFIRNPGNGYFLLRYSCRCVVRVPCKEG